MYCPTLNQNNRASLPQTKTFKPVSQSKRSILWIDYLGHFIPVKESKLKRISQVPGTYHVLGFINYSYLSFKLYHSVNTGIFFHDMYENKYTERLQH